MLAQVGNQGNIGNQNGGVVVLTRWIEKMENVQDMSGCGIDQKVKYTGGSFVEFCPSHEMQKLEIELWNHVKVGAGHAAYTDMFHELARLVPHLVTLESRKIERYVYGLALQIRGMVATMKPKTMQKAVQISGALTDEAIRNGSIKKVEKRGNVGEPSKDNNGRDDNKRTRTGNVFATTVSPVDRESMGTWPKCATCNSYHAPGRPCRTCFNCNRPYHLAKGCKSVPRNVNPINTRNPPVRACYKCGEPSKDKNGRDDNKRTRTGNVFATTVSPVDRESMGTWPKCATCNSYHAPGRPCRTCFNCNRPYHLAKDCKSVPRNVNPINTRNPPVRACYKCGSTDRVRSACPRLNRAQGPKGNRIEPSDLGFRYEIEIASGQLVEIDKVTKGCKLEIEGHVFDIDLITFRHESFDVII
nr:reverse transcriptase domain-containing protein [Tanacetum cinerariifolium]